MSDVYQKGLQKEYVQILLIIVLGLILRLYLFYLHQVIDYDGVYYAMLGKNLFSGAGYTEPEGIYQWYYPPLYPVNIGLLWYMVRDLELASKSVSLIYGTLSVPMVYLIARKIYGNREAVISGIFVALHPNLIRLSSTDTADSQFIFLLLSIILFTLYTVRSPSMLKFGILGILFGLLFLSKPAGVQYFVFYIVLLTLIGLINRWDRIKLTKQVLIAVIIFSMFALPYLVFLKNHYGYWTLSELATRNLVRSLLIFNGDNRQKVYQLTPDGTEMKYFTSDSYPGEHLSLVDVFRDDPRGFVKRYVYNFGNEFVLMFDGIEIFTVPIVVFILMNFACRKWDRAKVVNELPLFAVLIPLITQPLISTTASRWLLPMVPVLLIWAAGGMVESQARLINKFGGSYRFLTRQFPAIFILFWLLTVTMPFILNSEGYAALYPHEHKEMGLQMKEDDISKDAVVMSITPHVSFYAGTRLKIMPWGEYDQIIKYARYHGVDFIVIDETFVPRRPQMLFLLDEDMAPPELRLAYKLVGKNKKKILVYKLIKDKVQVLPR